MRKEIHWTRGERIVGLSVFGGVFVLAALTLWFSFLDEGEPVVLRAGTDLVLPFARLKPGKLFLFRYPIGPSASIPVAVQKGSDGTIRAALASCRACPKSRNFAWSGRLICGHCRHVMRMPDPGTRPDEKKPGCVLASLAYSAMKGEVLVRGEIIEAEYSRQFGQGDAGRANR